MRTGDLGKRGLLDVPKSHSQIIKTLVYFSYCDIFHRMSVLKINKVVYICIKEKMFNLLCSLPLVNLLLPLEIYFDSWIILYSFSETWWHYCSSGWSLVYFVLIAHIYFLIIFIDAQIAVCVCTMQYVS